MQLIPRPHQRLREAQAPWLGGQGARRWPERSSSACCRLDAGRHGHRNASHPPWRRAVGRCERRRVAARLELPRIVPWGRVTPAPLTFDVPARLRWSWRVCGRQRRRERGGQRQRRRRRRRFASGQSHSVLLSWPALLCGVGARGAPVWARSESRPVVQYST